MAEMILLKIGGTDITEYIDRQNFSMNKADVGDAWTDGNGIEHRIIIRTRISGKAVAGFSQATDFASFCNLLTTARHEDGYYSVMAYINNTGTTETFGAFLDVVTNSKWDWANNRQWHTVTLKITER